MVDVKTHRVFPTIISEFHYDMDAEEKQRVINHLLSSDDVDNTSDIIQTGDKLNVQIPKFTKHISEVANKILKDTFLYKYDKIELTGMWANHCIANDTHPPHTHSNNIISGVYYVEAKDESPIQFFDPRPQASVLHPNMTATNFDNSGMIQFDSEEGFGLMFPSWLQHWVPRVQSNRMSISWNILLRGDYGQPGTLQNSHI
tara:strand:- start:157 stop:759 length:603 start_codon:yes stop_codon:yes gene_type:complete